MMLCSGNVDVRLTSVLCVNSKVEKILTSVKTDSQGKLKDMINSSFKNVPHKVF